MLFSAPMLLASAAPLSSKDPKVICKTPGACLKITRFDAIAPLYPKEGDQTSFNFDILSDVPSFGASTTCKAKWMYPDQEWPTQSKTCKYNAFSFKVNNFVDIDEDFEIEAKYLYRDPKVAGPTPPPKKVAPMDTVTNFAKGTVSSDNVECVNVGTVSKYCHLKENAEILLVITSRTA